MTASLAQGLGAALGASLVYGAAPVVQAREVQDVRPGRGFGLRLTARLARRPWWLAGFACEIGGFVLEAVAFSAAPATLVAPVLACDMLVFILLCWPVLGARPSPTSLIGAAIMATGIALLGFSFSPGEGLGSTAGTVELLSFGGAAIAVAGVATLAARRVVRRHRRRAAAVAFGGAAGIVYGFATLATRQVGRTFSLDDPWSLLATPTVYLLAVCSVLGISLMQRSLQFEPVVTYPLVSGGSTLLPVLMGIAVLDEGVPTGAEEVIFALALVALAVGIVLLSSGRSVSAPATPEAAHDEAGTTKAR